MVGFLGIHSVTFKPVLGNILFFSAGPDQQTQCSPITITLTATVIGDLTGHTILWEQIGGPVDIVWVTPQNQLIVQWTSTTTADRTFRFWIDKGFPYQQFDDVTVYGSPLDQLGTSLAARIEQAQAGPIRNCRIPQVSLIPVGASNSGGASAGCSFTTYRIVWSMPTCELDELIGFIVQQKCDGDNWINLGRFPPSPSSFAPTLVGCSYRVVAVYRNANDFLVISNPQMYLSYSNTLYASPFLETFNGFYGIDSLGNSGTGLQQNFGVMNEFGAVTSVNPGTNFITTTLTQVQNNFTVTFTGPPASLPGGITAGQRYYIVNSSGSSFQISFTYGGSPIDITSTGTARADMETKRTLLVTLTFADPTTYPELDSDRLGTTTTGADDDWSSTEGVGFVLSANPTTDVITTNLSSAQVINNTEVYFYGTGLPGGITAGQRYYIANASGSTFQISNTPWIGLSPFSLPVVDITSTGIGKVVTSTIAKLLVTAKYIDPTTYPELDSDRLGTTLTGADDDWSSTEEVGFVTQAATQIARTGNTTIGSPIITNLSSVAGLTIGQPITGTGIPASTVIRSIDSGTQITVTNNASASGTGVRLSFSNNDIITNLLTVAIDQRVTFQGTSLPSPLVAGQVYYIQQAVSSNTMKLSIANSVGVRITGVVTGVGGKWIIWGNYASIILSNQRFVVSGTGSGDGTYITLSAANVGQTTEITINGTIPGGAVISPTSRMVFSPLPIWSTGIGKVTKNSIVLYGFSRIGS